MSNKIGLCKYCWEVLCSQCQENLIDDDNDHVSKSELRKWCEEEKSSLIHNVWHDDEKAGYTWAINEILEKFCKEGE